jgi:hypothetical protein
MFLRSKSSSDHSHLSCQSQQKEKQQKNMKTHRKSLSFYIK